MLLIVVTSGSYPYGGAATNRHLSYLKGLVDLGVKVNLLIIQPDRNQSKLSDRKAGLYDGIEFEYFSWKSIYNKILIRRLFSKVYSHAKILQRINQIKKKNPNEDLKLLLLVTKTFDLLPYLIAKNKYNIPIFHERSEHPTIYLKGFFGKLSLQFYLRKIIPLFDGIYVITESLVDYFLPYVKSKDKILHLPMSVDLERFEDNSVKIRQYGKYIAYCGSMYTDKDGVPDLIDAFDKFCKSNDDVNLLLIGDNEDAKKFKYINERINRSQYRNRIFCTGYIERDDIPNYLKNAMILALARPNNIQARGGFPTKLGEYLATGNPVVITDVGEHTQYLKDGVSAFIAPSGDSSEFCKKLLEAVNNQSKAKLIGEEGKKVALVYFNYKIQAQKLYTFLNDA